MTEFGVPLSTKPELNEFMSVDRAIVLADSTGRILFDSFLKCKALKFEWGPRHENKRPDFLIKKDDSFWIVEHKHMKEFGGGQNKQVNEIIDFVGQSEQHPDIHYVSFLDGILFNRIFIHEGDAKVVVQRSRIINNLKECPNNYFVNTAGFCHLMVPAGTPLKISQIREANAEYRLNAKNF